MKKMKLIQKYRFQRIIIIVAAILWLLTAFNILRQGTQRQTPHKETDMVSAFCENIYSNISAEITAAGVLGRDYLTDSAKQYVLEQAARDIGISRYDINKVSDEYGSTITLSQDSLYGSVTLKISDVSDISDAQKENGAYLLMKVTLTDRMDCTFAYKEILQDICDTYGVDTNVNVLLKGEMIGNISMAQRDRISNELLSQTSARVISSKKDSDIYTVYAYDDKMEDYIYLGKDRININLSMSYDNERNVTKIYFATPINNEDF